MISINVSHVSEHAQRTAALRTSSAKRGNTILSFREDAPLRLLRECALIITILPQGPTPHCHYSSAPRVTLNKVSSFFKTLKEKEEKI